HRALRGAGWSYDLNEAVAGPEMPPEVSIPVARHSKLEPRRAHTSNGSSLNGASAPENENAVGVRELAGRPGKVLTLDDDVESGIRARRSGAGGYHRRRDARDCRGS